MKTKVEEIDILCNLTADMVKQLIITTTEPDLTRYLMKVYDYLKEEPGPNKIVHVIKEVK